MDIQDIKYVLYNIVAKMYLALLGIYRIILLKQMLLNYEMVFVTQLES